VKLKTESKCHTLITFYFSHQTEWLRIGRLVFDSRAVTDVVSSHPRPDGLWDPPGLLSNAYRNLFLWGQSGQGVKLTAHFQLMPSLRMCGVIPPFFHMSLWRSA